MALTGLTPFICNMIRTPRDHLTSADPQKLAVKYGVPVEWARFYLRNWMEGV